MRVIRAVTKVRFAPKPVQSSMNQPWGHWVGWYFMPLTWFRHQSRRLKQLQSFYGVPLHRGVTWITVSLATYLSQSLHLRHLAANACKGIYTIAISVPSFLSYIDQIVRQDLLMIGAVMDRSAVVLGRHKTEEIINWLFRNWNVLSPAHDKTTPECKIDNPVFCPVLAIWSDRK